MLDLLRKNTRSFVIYLLFAIIIVVFVFTFNTITPGQACGSEGATALTAELAEVGNVDVDTNLLNMAAVLTIDPPSPGANELEALQRRFAYRSTRFLNLGLPTAYPDFGPDPLQVSPIEIEKAMGDLVESILVAQEAREMGLSVSNAELTERLVSDESWYDPETGAFRRDQYEGFVRYQLGTTIVRFEEFVRWELLREKLIAVLTSGVTVSDAEVAFAHRTRNEKVELEAVVVDDAAAADLVPAGEEAVSGWLQANQEEVTTYYEEHEDEFKKAERVVVRGIQVKAPNRALLRMEKDEERKAEMEGQREEARKRAADVVAGLREEATTVTPEAEEAPEGAEPAEAPEPIEDVVPEEAFVAAVEEHSDHSATKDSGGLFPEPRERDAMSRWPFGEDAAEAVFGLKPGQVTDVVEVDSGFWVLRLEETLEPEEKALADVRMDIAGKLYRQEKAEAFKEEVADAVLEAAKASPDQPLSEIVDQLNEEYGAAEGEGLVAIETGMFARLQPGGMGGGTQFGNVPRIGQSEELVKAAFAATEESPLLDRVVELADGQKLVVARRAGAEGAGEQEEAEATELRANLLREKQKTVYRGWYHDLFQSALDSDRVAFTDDWRAMVQNAVDAYRQAGGTLPSARTEADEQPEQAEEAPAEEPPEG